MTTTKTLKEDVTELNGNLAKLAGTLRGVKLPPGQKHIPIQKSTLGALQKDVQLIDMALRLPRQVNKRLGNIKSALDALSSVLTALSFVKQVKKIADRMNKQIKDLKSKISKAETKLDSIENAVKPYKPAVKEIDKELTELIVMIQGFQMGLIKYSAILIKVEKCITSFPKGQIRTEMENNLNEIVTESDESVVVLNQILEILMSASDSLKAYLKEKIMDAVHMVDPIDDAIDKFEDQLELLLDPLEDLNELLTSSVSAKFKYPSPTMTNPFRMKTKKLKISVSIVLKGTKEVEKQAKKILSKALFEALELFGLDKVVKKLVKSAKKSIDKLLNKANLNLPIEIKALDTLDVKFDDLLDCLNGIEFDIDFKTPKIALEGFEVSGLAFRSCLDTCELNKRKGKF